MNTLSPDGQQCLICLDRYPTPEEAVNHVFKELPFELWEGPERDPVENPSRADVPYRTPWGHVMGIHCLEKSLDGALYVEKWLGARPFCRTPLARDYPAEYFVA